MLAEAGDVASAILNKRGWRTRIPTSPTAFQAPLRRCGARSKRIEALAKKVPGHIEGALADGARRARRPGAKAGRRRRSPPSAAPSKRIALLMAEPGNAPKAAPANGLRAPSTPRPSEWTAEGHISDHWLPVLPGGRVLRLRVARSADRHRLPVAIDQEHAAIAGRSAAAAASEPKSESAAAGALGPAPQEKSATLAAAEPVVALPHRWSSAPLQGKARPVIPRTRPTIPALKAPAKSSRNPSRQTAAGGRFWGENRV